jgi:hypothetical protein
MNGPAMRRCTAEREKAAGKLSPNTWPNLVSHGIVQGRSCAAEQSNHT